MIHLPETRGCQYGACPRREARYMIGWEEGTEVVWGAVCGSHDRYLGRLNIAAWKGCTLRQAVNLDNLWNREARKEGMG